MKYFGLIWAQLWRRPKRTWFTVISIAVAFLLFAVLIGFNVVLDSGLSKLNNRLFVTSKYAQEQLPLGYLSRVEETPGVTGVSTGVSTDTVGSSTAGYVARSITSAGTTITMSLPTCRSERSVAAPAPST